LEIEQTFDVQIDDVEAWVDESPSLLRVAHYIIERSARRSPISNASRSATCEERG